MRTGKECTDVLAALEEQFQRRRHHGATVFKDRRRTFGDLDQLSARLSEALLQPPDSVPPDVAACTKAPDDTVLTFLAAARLSACCTPLVPSTATSVEVPPSCCAVVDGETAGRFALHKRTVKVADALQAGDGGGRELLKAPPADRRPLLKVIGEDGPCELGAERCLSRYRWEWTEPVGADQQHTVAVLDGVDTARFWEDVLSALCSGSTVALPTEEDKRSPSALLRFLRDASATRVEMTPDALWALLARVSLESPQSQPLPALRLVKCSRGLVPVRLARLFLRLLPGVRLLCVYEHDGRCCAYACSESVLRHHPTDHGDFVVLGKAVGDCRTAVCHDGQCAECAQGTVGNICLGGAKDDQLLATGDSGFVDSDGYLVLTGRSAPRIDGRKVDIAQVSKCLTSIPAVSDAEVCWERLSSPQTTLVAFYWSDVAGDLSGELFHPLASKLPCGWMPLLFPMGPPPKGQRPDRRALLREYAAAIDKLLQCKEVNVERGAPLLVALAHALDLPVVHVDVNASYANQKAGKCATTAAEAAALLEHMGYEVSVSELCGVAPLRLLVERASCSMVLPGPRRLRVSLVDADTPFDEVAGLLAHCFTSKNRLDLTVHNTEDQHVRSLRHLWPQLLREGASRLVRDEEGRLLAVAICCDFGVELTAPDNMAESFLAIAEINESMERPLRALVNARGQRFLLLFMVGTGTDDRCDNIGLVVLMIANLLRDAKALRYDGAASVNSHVVTNVITQRWFHFDVFEEAQVADFEYHGRRPFATVRPGTLITSVCRFLDRLT
ncbi:uncharacterized protein LOC144128798 [Amblyomma americanum]